MPKRLFNNDLLDQSRKFVSVEFVSALLEHPSNQTLFQMRSWKASFMDACSTVSTTCVTILSWKTFHPPQG